MIRAGFIAAFAASALLWPEPGHTQTPDEKAVTDVLEATLNADTAADFTRMVALIHPQTQHLFRDILSARFDVLLRSYLLTDIVSISGLPAHPKDLSLTDWQFFVFACNSTKARHPDFADYSKYLPLTIEGTTFDKDQRAHVVLSWPDSVHTERTDFNFVGSIHVFFRHEQSGWLLWSCPLAQSIGDIWCRDLARTRIAQQSVR